MKVLLRRREVESKTCLSCATIYRLIAAGQFPKPIRLTKGSPTGRGGSVAWQESDVSSWIDARISESTESQG